MQATPEQLAICESRAEVLKIKALAGTGKTTTLRGLAGRHRDKKILYLAFNKAIKEEAQGKFVKNVRAMTAHGLAFASVGKHFANTPNKLHHGELKPFHVLPLLSRSLKGVPPTIHNLYGARVIETIRNYLISPEVDLGDEHLSLSASPAEKKHFSPTQLMEDAEGIWMEMQDLRSLVPMTHDGYLKLFQRNLPDLGYDMVMVDEYQDTNPVLQSLVEIQPCRRVYVGDEHQAIYGFRGAHNAMATAQADEELYLTGSFRFGQAIADMANTILDAKGEKMSLRGLGAASDLCPIPFGATHTFISRGNSALFGRAVQALDRREAFAFVGPIQNYRLDLIEQVYRLSIRDRVSDPFLKAFKSFEELEEYATAMEDREIIGRCRLVTKYGGRIPTLVSHITSNAGTYPDKPGDAKVVLTSAHRSKGLEFANVQLADDFMDFYDEEKEEWKDLTQASARDREEVNLQYVAATRAQGRLEVGEKLQKFWDHTQDLAAQAKEKAARLALEPEVQIPEVVPTRMRFSRAQSPS